MWRRTAGRSRDGILVVLTIALVGAVFAVPSHSDARRRRARTRSRAITHEPAVADARHADTMTDAGRSATGLYFSGRYVEHFGVRGVIYNVQRAHLNAAVIDVKDDAGRVLFDTSIPELAASENHMLGDARAMVRALKDAHVYAIGRIVCFADPLLPRRDLDRAVRDTRPGRQNQPWVSWGTGETWLDPSNPANHELLRRLAVETAALGFDEIQFDYIRFPVDGGTRFARFPHLDPHRARRYVLRDFLRSVDESIRIPISVAVFGLTALRPHDPTELGQGILEWTDFVDAFSPMLYINAYHSWRPNDGAVSRAGSLVEAATATLRQRMDRRAVVRPFLQGFDNGVAEVFGADFIFAQVRAARQGRADGFLFWDPGNNYRAVFDGMRRGRSLVPFRR